jgi:hypothetical protein
MPLVDEDVQGHCGHLGALHPAQGAGGQVARIGVGDFHPGVDGVEQGPGQEDFSSHGRRDRAGQAQGDRADGAHVARDVVAHQAIAAGHGPDQQPLPVVQHDRGAVDLLLRHEGQAPAARLPAFLDPGVQLRGGVGLVQAQNRDAVGHFGQLLGQVAAHPLRGGILGAQLRVQLLHLQEAVVEPVVFLVAHRGAGQHVVLVLVAPQEVAEAEHLPVQRLLAPGLPLGAIRRTGRRHPGSRGPGTGTAGSRFRRGSAVRSAP